MLLRCFPSKICFGKRVDFNASISFLIWTTGFSNEDVYPTTYYTSLSPASTGEVGLSGSSQCGLRALRSRRERPRRSAASLLVAVGAIWRVWASMISFQKMLVFENFGISVFLASLRFTYGLSSFLEMPRDFRCRFRCGRH